MAAGSSMDWFRLSPSIDRAMRINQAAEFQSGSASFFDGLWRLNSGSQPYDKTLPPSPVPTAMTSAHFLRLACFSLFAIAPAAVARETALPLAGISYQSAEKPVDDPDGRCRLDLRLPENGKGFATLVWFHGGGLTGGSRDFPKYNGREIAFVSAGYRLSTQVPCPVFIEDAAAAVAWTIHHIADYGGDPDKVFIGGHSAGAYLALLVGTDPRWLKPHGLSPADIAGILPVSAQVTTHFRVKEMRGNTADPLVPVIDEFAPLYYVAKAGPPICLITGDRLLDTPCRVEENDFMAATLRKLGRPDVEFHELKGLNHNTVTTGAAKIMPDFITRISKGGQIAK